MRTGKRARKNSGADERGYTRKLFVLDTNVLMHDPTSIFCFEEHDVFLPMMTLEELDNHKRGTSEVARNARQVSRTLDTLLSLEKGPIENGIPLSLLGHSRAKGRLFFQTLSNDTSRDPIHLQMEMADNQILAVVRALKECKPNHEVVLVSKDINMRVKAHALGLSVSDYTNDKVLEDTDLLYPGTFELPQNFWELIGERNIEAWNDGAETFYRLHHQSLASLLVGQFVWLEPSQGVPFYARVREVSGDTVKLQKILDYTHPKNAVWGVTARNREQSFALNLLMDSECDLVTLVGQAGTGKTLLALAAGLALTFERKRFSEIIVTRATVPVGEDIGFLPGTEEEKMAPWMGALEDNLEVLTQSDAHADWGRGATRDVIHSRVRIKSMSFMRGRTFVNKYLIIDEAQNLTSKQMKTLITRAGPGTKVVCLGNIAQIDTPYLSEGSSGLTYLVDRMKGWAHAGHVMLLRGERSRLADYASEAL